MTDSPSLAVADAAEAVLRLSPAVRYVAIAVGGELHRREAGGRTDASASESDYYEERLVNPTLLDLARRRGAEGCGGFDFLVVGYGHFHQVLVPLMGGHVSVAVELAANPLTLVGPIIAATRALAPQAPAGTPPLPISPLADEPWFAWDDPVDAVGESLVGSLYRVVEGVRYVALNRSGRLVLSSRVGEVNVGDRSDRYEELIVNPTLLAMSRARGQIDCGGVRYLVVTYPTFLALILPLPDGHATVSLPRTSDPIGLLSAFEAVVERGTRIPNP